ncbi:MAG: uroporphyrinogen-III synthase [Parachlamydiaceae bacterium]
MDKHILYLGLDPSHYKRDRPLIHYPIIKIVPRSLSDSAIHVPLKNFDDYSHIIITSKSTAAILRDYLPKMGINLESWRKKTTLAVGKVTASHLQAFGIHPSKIEEEETAEGMIAQIAKSSLAGAHLFWPHSAKARPIIEHFFLSHGIGYTSCILYDTIIQQPGPLPDLKKIDEIIFTSPSTVDAFLHLFGTFPPHIQLTSIGPITAQHLNTHLRHQACVR